MNNNRKDKAPTRARKVACLRSFFKYAWNKANLISENPAAELESPKITKIGAMLKEMRLQKGLKLVDVSKKLCIRKFYLEAIEESNYSEIPPFPYGNGFIRSYANFLGLNSENIIELYKEETSLSKDKSINILEPQAEATMPNIQHILISLLAIVLIYIGWLFYNQNSRTNETSDTTYTEEENTATYDDVVMVENFNDENSNEITSTPTEEKASSEPQIVVSEEIYQENKPTDIKNKTENNENTEAEEKNKSQKPENMSNGVYIEVLKTTWVEIKDKDKLYLSKVLQPGEFYKVPEGEGKILSVGKHDGVNIYINGVLTNVVRPQKKMNIFLDKYINPEL